MPEINVTREKVMKPKKEVSAKKEDFVRDLMRKTDLNPRQINGRVAAQFGSPLRTNKLYELKREILREKEQGITGAAEVRPKTAARVSQSRPVPAEPAPATTRDTLPQVIRFQPGEPPGALLERSLAALRKAGLTTVGVATSTDRYAIVDAT